jgi:hypothetical protein
MTLKRRKVIAQISSLALIEAIFDARVSAAYAHEMLWSTLVINHTQGSITVNGTPITAGQQTTFPYNGAGVQVVVPDVGTISFSEPGSDNYHPYVSTTWAVKIVSGNYLGYWGYEGGPTMTVTINDDDTFSLGPNFNAIPISGIPITQWAGEYSTNTHWWGGYFSPLLIQSDGTVSIAETLIHATYNSAGRRLTFDWTPINTTTAKASIQFADSPGGKVCSGTLNPRPQDGPVGFTGSEVVIFPPPTASDLNLANDLFVSGDLWSIEASNQQFLAVGPQNSLVANAPTIASATKFATDISDDGIRLKVNGNYVSLDAQGALYVGSNDPTTAMLINASLSPNDAFTLNYPAGGKYWTLTTTGAIGTRNIVSLDQDVLFQIYPEVLLQAQMHALLGLSARHLDSISACDIAMAKVVYQFTVGLALASGGLPYLLDSKALPGIVGLLRAYPSVNGLIVTAEAAIYTGKTAAIGGAVATFLFTVDRHFLWKIIRLIWDNFATLILSSVAAKILRLLILPEGEAAVIIASLGAWAYTTYIYVQDMQQTCG